MAFIATIGATLGRWLGVAGNEKRATDISVLVEALGGQPTLAGVKVGPQEALGASAVYNAIEMLSNDVAGLPCGVYRRVPGGSEALRNHAADKLVRYKPNPEMTAFQYRQTVMAHKLGWGNSFSEILHDGGGNPVELWPLPPNKIRIKRDPVTQELIYLYRDNMGREAVILARNMLHIAGLGFDGVLGYSVITKARESMGLTLAAQEYGAAFFGNSAQPSGVLQHPESLSQPAQDRLKATWKANYGGKKAYSVAILEEGMKWQPITMSAKDSQFLETRKFQTTEIARWFNVPPHKLKDLEKATFSNIEQQSIDYVTTSLMPHLTAIEQACRLKLLKESEQSDLFFKHVVQALLRGEVKARYEVYAIAVRNGIMTRAEVRELEDLPPNADPALNLFTFEANMQVLSMDLLKPPEPPPAPPPPADEPDEDEDVDEEEDDDSTRGDAIRAAHRPLIAEAIRRLLRKEAKAARAAAKKPKEFNDWIDVYYRKHDLSCRQALLPIARAYEDTLWHFVIGMDSRDRADVDDVVCRFIIDMTDAAAKTLNDLSGRCVPDALAGEVNALVMPWQTDETLVYQLADELLAAIDQRMRPEPIGV